MNGTAFSRISRKADNLTRYTQIFKNFVWKFQFHLIFLLEERFEFQKIQQFSDFKETNPRKSPYHLLPPQKVGNFWLNGKRGVFPEISVMY